MTDKELLELAAKAAGITGWQSKHGYWNMKDIDGIDVVCCSNWPRFDSNTGQELNPTFSDAIEELNWNPLTDDGNALRLAVKLGIQVLPNYKSASGKLMTWAGIGMQTIYEPHDEDAMEATRRAIVKAAALIGKELK